MIPTYLSIIIPIYNERDNVDILYKEIRESVEYHQALFGLLLLKYDVLVRPSIELRKIEQNNNGSDAMFEMIKRFQQYPETDKAT